MKKFFGNQITIKVTQVLSAVVGEVDPIVKTTKLEK